MTTAELFKQYLEHLFAGKRFEAREVVLSAQDRGVPASKLLKQIIWPAMEQVDQLYREDRIPRVVANLAARINRLAADQLQGYLARKPKSGQRMVTVCGEGEIEELGAQIVCDLFEAEGWQVWFVGSGVPDDEVLQLIGKLEPDLLCVYGSQPSDVPGIRKLIEFIREVGVCEQMQVLTMGGVFNRADGLAEEVKADLSAKNVTEAVKVVADHPVRVPKPDLPEPGRRRKRKRKTVSP